MQVNDSLQTANLKLEEAAVNLAVNRQMLEEVQFRHSIEA